MIQPIKEIPLTDKQKSISRREMLRSDLLEAIEQNVTQFELIGDYNYKYLNQYAREELDRIFRRKTFDYEKQFKEKKSIPKDVHIYPYRDTRCFYEVHSKTMDDRKHTYVELHLDNFEKIMEDRCEKALIEAIARRNVRRAKE